MKDPLLRSMRDKVERLSNAIEPTAILIHETCDVFARVLVKATKMQVRIQIGGINISREPSREQPHPTSAP